MPLSEARAFSESSSLGLDALRGVLDLGGELVGLLDDGAEVVDHHVQRLGHVVHGVGLAQVDAHGQITLGDLLDAALELEGRAGELVGVEDADDGHDDDVHHDDEEKETGTR